MRRTELYVVDGVRVPSVTEILQICGLCDFGGIPIQTLEAARYRGLEVHEWCELLDAGHLAPEDNPDDSISGYIAAYLLFKEEAGFEIELNEHVVVSEQYRYAGTLDRMGYLRNLRKPDEPKVIDIKAVAMVSAATPLQIEGYSNALGRVVGNGASLQLRKDGTYRLKEYDQALAYSNWFACVRLAHFKLENQLATLEN